MIETVGLGGVGKTQVAVEYCYRHWQQTSSTSALSPSAALTTTAADAASTIASSARQNGTPRDATGEDIEPGNDNRRHSTSYYSLIMWLRAETAEVLGADFRRFAADSGIASVQGARNEDVVAEVLSKLYQVSLLGDC